MNPHRPLKIVVTSGPTREWIDPVRYITNPSSGKTGYYLAIAALSEFSEVVYIAGATQERYKSVPGARTLPVETTEEMAAAVEAEIGPETLLFMAAAPSDFRIAHPSNHKIKKEKPESFTLELAPNPDILVQIRDRKFENFYRVGFAAETDNLIENAREKLKRKNLDFICANSVDRSRKGFGENENRLIVIDRSLKQKEIGPLEKEALATALFQWILNAIGYGNAETEI